MHLDVSVRTSERKAIFSPSVQSLHAFQPSDAQSVVHRRRPSRGL